MTNSLRIFLADDHAVVRAGLKALIHAEADMAVIGEAANGRDAADCIRACLPDVAVIDVTMPGMDGAHVAESLRITCPNVRVLALTVHEDRSYLHQLLEAGAAGYVLKRAAGDELIRAIRSVAAGNTYIDSHVAERLVNTCINLSARRHLARAGLTERETEVIRPIAQGYTTKEVANKLSISAKTVETYKKRSMSKLRLQGRVELVQMAVERGWLVEATPPTINRPAIAPPR